MKKSKEEIKAEYLKLQGVYCKMAGNLYPLITYKKLMELREQYVGLGWGTGREDDATDFWSDLPPVTPPNNFGYIQL